LSKNFDFEAPSRIDKEKLFLAIFCIFILQELLNSIVFSGEVKLCDFGESRILEDSTASTNAGTNLYWPPERFCGGTYDIKTEVWSLGITLLEIILGKLPYDSETNNMIDLHKNIANANFEEIIGKEIKPVYSEVLCDQLRWCTQRVESRPNLETLKSSRFYQEYSNLNEEEISSFFASFQV
jgi:serine/threonine protein kinase